MRPERIELPTSWFVAKHSIQLSYGRIRFQIITETESFRPIESPETLAGNSASEFDLRFRITPDAARAVEIGALAEIANL